MKKFFVTFLATPEAIAQWNSMDKETAKAGMDAWKQWFKTHAQSIVDQGSSLGKTKRVSQKMITDGKNQLIGYAVVQAESSDDAAKLFLDHPNADMEGGAVEIIEMLGMPEM